jgi:hypothetical protein
LKNIFFKLFLYQEQLVGAVIEEFPTAAHTHITIFSTAAGNLMKKSAKKILPPSLSENRLNGYSRLSEIVLRLYWQISESFNQ